MWLRTCSGFLGVFDGGQGGALVAVGCSIEVGCQHHCAGIYRVDWELAAASRRCAGVVLGVFWRCLTVLSGKFTPNPTLIAEKSLF